MAQTFHRKSVLTLRNKAKQAAIEGEPLFIQKGDTVFVPACQGELLLEGDLEMLLVQI